MSFKIVITEISETDEKETQRYQQTVDDIDLPRIIAAINAKKRVYTKRAKKGGEQP